jgi:lipid-binding SYLF domain-containing protein
MIPKGRVNEMIKANRFMTIFLSVVFLVSSTAVFAQDRDHAPSATTKADDQAERALEAAKVLNEVMATPDKGIPEELMSRAQGIAVIPHVVKGAFGIGGQYGKGLMSKRLANGQWSSPAFINIGGGSFGLQLGVEATDLVLVFTDSKGVDAITKGKLKLGADASVAAGPVGRRAEAGTDVLLRSGILSYSRSKGLFAGISLDGSVIEADDSANTKVFGANSSIEHVLSGKATANPVVAPFVAALEKHTPAGTK